MHRVFYYKSNIAADKASVISYGEFIIIYNNGVHLFSGLFIFYTFQAIFVNIM